MLKFLVRIVLALLVSLVIGLVIGTILRSRMEAPVEYLGQRVPAGSALAAGPLDVGNAGTAVLDPGHHEQQVREAVQVA